LPRFFIEALPDALQALLRLPGADLDDVRGLRVLAPWRDAASGGVRSRNLVSTSNWRACPLPVLTDDACRRVWPALFSEGTRQAHV
jgi:hypothetical protein